MKVFKCLVSFMNYKEGEIYMGTQVAEDVWKIYTHDNYPLRFSEEELREGNPIFEYIELI